MVIAVEQMHGGRISTEEAVAYFKAKGLITTDEESIREWEREQARTIIERARKFHKRTGQVQLELVNIWETTEDGKRVHYWKRFGELDPQEALCLLEYWRKRVDYDAREFHRYYKPLVRMHGRKLRQLILFDVPPEPAAVEA